ncbi:MULTISPECIES: cyclase family protein [Anaerotruncus]|uniref:cyclase family protein n=1 Tax=Anaerotruncus TaxID=244127 RepID=UPI00082BCB13|nr:MULTISPECIES: cyclase family protein [Anaerotruncus]
MAKKVYDLTQELYMGMPIWPGHVRTVVWTHDTHEGTLKEPGGYSWESRGIMVSDHGGTHVDAVTHMTDDPAAPSIEQIPLDKFYGTAVCLDVSETDRDGFITPEILDRAEEKLRAAGQEIRPDDIVLLFTGAWAYHHDDKDFLTRYAGLDGPGTEWLVNKKVKNFGIDAPSTDNPKAPWFPSHLVTKEHWLIHIEYLADLRPVVNKRFMFYGFPLKVRGGTGSPIRAVAEVDE